MTSDQHGSADQRNGANPSRHVYAESDYGHLSFGWSTLRAWRTEKYLYIEAPERELYDQSADPLAAHNLAPESKAVADTSAALLAEFYRKTKGADTEKTELNVEQNESLHALGYMSSSSGTSRTSDTQSGPDPKQRIAVANLFYEALVDVENERYEQAVPALYQVLKQYPNTPSAYLQLDRSYMALN